MAIATKRVTPASGAPQRGSGKFLNIVRRQADGSWKSARVIWNAELTSAWITERSAKPPNTAMEPTIGAVGFVVVCNGDGPRRLRLIARPLGRQ